MEFHDILQGYMKFRDADALTALLHELIDTPEINRLRNMRQMNFDVPLIQELGRSRRLPHSIGVANLAYGLAHRSALNSEDSAILLAASILHDAAIPPYGHLVESEFKSILKTFSHEERVKDLIKGGVNQENKYLRIVPGRSLQVSTVLRKYGVNEDKVINVICPTRGQKTPISADIDLDNIDNVHRMAAMLGWADARSNFLDIVSNLSLKGLGQMRISRAAQPALEKWLDFRQRIYTLIIAHPECIPHNALQADLVRIAVREQIIRPDDWFLSEPEFEEVLRGEGKATRSLATQLISGCEYQLVDYIWAKGFNALRKLSNSEIITEMNAAVPLPDDHGYFVWNEKGLISREISVVGDGWRGESIGSTSTSCMVALIKKTPGRPKWTKSLTGRWRHDSVSALSQILDADHLEVDFPESYTGNFLENRTSEIRF